MDMREKDGPAVEVAGPSGDPAALERPSQWRECRQLARGRRQARDQEPARRRTSVSRGGFIAVEGIDGSGKSTQLLLLERWLRTRGYPVHFTEWNSSRLVRRSMSRGKKKNLLTPTTFSLLHAVDFADRLTYQILPPLKAGDDRAGGSVRFHRIRA